MRQIFGLICIATLLTACATPTPYQAATERFGYAEQRIDATKFRVTFSGNSLTKRETVEDYLLYRAAELTIANGFDHFLMVSRDTESKTYLRERIDLYGGRGWFWHGWSTWYPHGYPRGWRDPFWDDPFTSPWAQRVYEPVTRFNAFADIEMVKGAAQRGTFQAFDARSVLTAIGPRVIRPEQQAK